MLKKIHTKTRPRMLKPAVTKSRWKSNMCVAIAGFLLLLSVCLLHTKLGAEGTDSRKGETSVEVRKISAARKALINRGNFVKDKHVDGKDRILDKTEGFNARFDEEEDLGKVNGGLGAGNGGESRENLEMTEKEEIDEEDEDKDGDEDLKNNEMEDFDGFDEDSEDKIDEMDVADENEEDEFPARREDEENEAERSLTTGIGHEDENVSVSENQSGEGNIWIGQHNSNGESKVKEDSGERLSGSDDGRINSVKNLQRLGQIKTIPRFNSNEERKTMKSSPYLIPGESKRAAGQFVHKGRAGLFWDHVMGVTRRAFLKHPQRQGAGHSKHPGSGNGKYDRGFDVQTNGGWEDSFVDESVASSNDRSKEAFSSDDEPIDEGVRHGLEEVTAIEDALLLNGGDRSSPLRSGWGPWFDNIQRRASKSDFLMRDRMARSTVDMLNPLNNPLLQDPDAIGPSGLTKSDKAMLKALKKVSIEGIPFIGVKSSHSEELPEKNLEEETGIEGKGQVQDAAGLQKTLEESNLDGGDEASVKERSNPDNDDDASLKDISRSRTELTRLTRKALDEHDSNGTALWGEGGNRNLVRLTEARGTGLIQSGGSAHVDKSKKLSHKRGLRENITSLAENFHGDRLEVHKNTSYRKNLPNKEQRAQREEDATRRLHGSSVSQLHESNYQASLRFGISFANRTLAADVNRSGSSNKITDYRSILRIDNVAPSNESIDIDRIAMTSKNPDRVPALKQEMNKAIGVADIGKIQRSGESKQVHYPAQKRVRRKYHRNDDTRTWGYYPGLDPLLSFSEFMDEFLGNGKCTLRVFMAWTTRPWSYTVRYQRGLESLLYFHPGACVVVFSDSIELDFFNDFVKDGYRVAVVMPNLDELLSNTPSHIFASVWLDWRKVDLYYIHYTELLRLAALYKYGGVYLDSDVVVLKALDSLVNTIGAESIVNEQFSLNGAVMAFEKHSPFLLGCLKEFTATYDDTQLRWNGAELLTRVADRYVKVSGENWSQYKAFRVQPPSAFFPLSLHNISSYFVAPNKQYEREMQEELLKRILNESFALHFWNNLTSNLVPETGSIVERVLNYHCLHCTDIL